MADSPERLERKRQDRRRYGRENREHLARLNREASQRLKFEVFGAYGSACACCGETEPLFLTIEHKGGMIPDSHREKSGARKTGYGLYLTIKREGFPDTIELLCWNCNAAKGIHGGCPHQRRLEEVV